MSQNVECPSCHRTVDVADDAEMLAACPHCLASFVPSGASAVVMQVQGESGNARDIGTIKLSEDFRSQYKLGRLLGRGAMGMVFEAQHLRQERVVAIKFLTQLDDANVLARFLREGNLMLQIEHPNVVRVYALAEEEGHPYIVTELMPGGTLRSRLQNDRKLTLDDTVKISLDVLAGLETVHERGIVHRDLKPENILFAADGTAKITDFGIAKDHSAKEKMTQTGQLLGTPQYISPEQIKNSEITRAADLYATGILIFEMLAGRPPFQSNDVFNLLMQQVSKAPPHVKDFAPEVPEEIGNLVARALSKKAAQRPSTAGQFASALKLSYEAFKSAPRPVAAPVEESPPPLEELPPPSSKKPLMFALLLFGVMGAAAFGTKALKNRLVTPDKPGIVVVDHAPPATPSPAASAAPATPSPGAPVASVSPAASGSPGAPVASVSPSPSSPAPVAASATPAPSPSPRKPGATVEAALAAFRAGSEADAERIARELVAKAPGDEKAVGALATVLDGAGAGAEAVQLLDAFVRAKPAARAIRLQLAEMLEQSNQADAAEAHYRALLTANPQDPDARAGMGSLHRQRGRVVDAERELGAALRADGRNAAALYQMGLLRRTMGRAVEAERYLRAAVASRRDHAGAHAGIAGLLEEQGRVPEALQWYEAAARLDPRRSAPPEKLATLFSRAGKHAEAEGYLRRALAQDAGNANLHKLLAASLRALGKARDADAHARIAALAEQKNVALLVTAGLSFSKENQHEEALACYSAALPLAPQNPVVLVNLGNALFRLRRVPEAKQHMEAALKIEPDNEVAKTNLAIMQQFEASERSGAR